MTLNTGNLVHFNSLYKSFEMDGIKLPSVSRVLSYGEPEPGAWIIKYAERGTRIHELCDEVDKKINWLPPDPEHEFEIECYLKSKKDLGIEKSDMIVEHACYHPDYLYQGRIDRIIPEHKMVIDVKSGKDNPKNEMQLNAYVEMYNPNSDHTGWRLVNIHLRKDEYFIKEYPFSDDVFAEFLSKLGKLRRGE